MAYLTLFCRKFPKNSRKKSQRSGREGGGSSRLGQNPNFYRKLVLEAPLKGKIKQFPYSNRKNLTRQTWTKQGPNFSLQKYQCYFILIPNLQNYVQKSGNCSFRDLCRNFIEAAPLLPAIREEYNQCTEPPPEYEWVWMKLEETFRLYLTNDQTSRGQTIWARTENQ